MLKFASVFSCWPSLDPLTVCLSFPLIHSMLSQCYQQRIFKKMSGAHIIQYFPSVFWFQARKPHSVLMFFSPWFRIIGMDAYTSALSLECFQYGGRLINDVTFQIILPMIYIFLIITCIIAVNCLVLLFSISCCVY